MDGKVLGEAGVWGASLVHSHCPGDVWWKSKRKLGSRLHARLPQVGKGSESAMRQIPLCPLKNPWRKKQKHKQEPKRREKSLTPPFLRPISPHHMTSRRRDVGVRELIPTRPDPTIYMV